MHRLGRHTRTIAVLACLLVLTNVRAAVAAPPGAPPAEAFATLPGIQMVAISPNGKMLAQDDVKNGQQRIIVWDIDTTKTLRVINVDAANKMRGLDWADDQTVLLDASIQKAVPCNATNRCTVEWWRTLAITLDGAPPHVLLMDDAARQWVTGATMLATRTARPNSVTMETQDWLATREKQSTGTRIVQSDRDRSGWTHVVFDVDTRTGKGKPLATGTTYTDQWVVDKAGDPVARSEWVQSRKEFSIYVRHGGGWSRVFEQSGHDPLTLSGLTLDGKSLVVLAAIDSEFQKAWAFPLDGTDRSVLYEIADGDVESALTDPNSHAVVALQTGGMEPGIHWLDPELGAHYRALTNAFAGKRVTEINRSNDGQRVVAMVDSASRPPTYHLVDFNKSRADVIGEAYPALATAKLGDVRTIHYPARDGTSIPAYLTLPPGGASKNLPVVVLPHGGPHWRDTGSFDYIVQFLATRGYAVLQPQFRGSTGFGDAYVKAGYRQWGGLMQDDVTDGVRHLIADGTADPHRICIAGLSYGGYAALAGAAFTPDLYACAASVGGVSDLPTLLSEAKRPFGSDTDAVASDEERIGKTYDPNVIAKSPARSAATVTAPVLMLHGVDDSVVPIAQSERMARALEKAGKPVKFVKLAGEDHWLSRGDTRLQVLKELDAFLAPLLAPVASSAPAAAKAP